MSSRSKLEKIAELKVLPNIFEEPGNLKGHWHEEVFQNDNPIILEIGCGRGEYTVNLARRFANKNFIGLDIKGPRIWKGAKIAVEESLHNAVFVRTLIENIEDYFLPGEVTEIWVPFPDPYPKPSKEQKRLVSSRFRELYKKLLQTKGQVHFKTDNEKLYEWAIGNLQNDPGIEVHEFTDDLYHSSSLNDLTAIQTTYETMFRAEGKPIKYIRFSFIK